ncbi:hypothetical protein NQ318_015686 [Aromia moschata]|uniref:Mos1 transposase HTH domain-containing protein n=1 Tax=Aromia moschata TaxID=1265417 RepID=A0AAV8YHI6_9CUCU|nr:hypothetical protein NQ318_015686 [Aromia moschata]
MLSVHVDIDGATVFEWFKRFKRDVKRSKTIRAAADGPQRQRQTKTLKKFVLTALRERVEYEDEDSICGDSEFVKFHQECTAVLLACKIRHYCAGTSTILTRPCPIAFTSDQTIQNSIPYCISSRLRCKEAEDPV